MYKKKRERKEFACFDVALNDPVTLMVCPDVNAGATVSSYITFHRAGSGAM